MTKSIRDEFLLSAQPSEEEEDYPNYNEEILEGKESDPEWNEAIDECLLGALEAGRANGDREVIHRVEADGMAHVWRTTYEPGRCLWLFVREARPGSGEVLVHGLTRRRSAAIHAAFEETDPDSAKFAESRNRGGEGEAA